MSRPHVLVIVADPEHPDCDCEPRCVSVSAECPASDLPDALWPHAFCAIWEECGCPPDRDEDPCPSSPTGEHKFVGTVLMQPTARCFVAQNDYLADAAQDISDEPGRYPVEFDFDGCDLILERAPGGES
jgi:hypothetical protein